ncbi:Radical SAM domain protein [uncultured Desulfobacterium sp.]|uniref:Radical SAM domain protein n=1 Tax=uncultured Desulfobacterium sp. TaxID=201089 RepID=A0A445MW03_9BACT|nr:Radical SAM domain protein [uncultured Desulfobacterium sp.]
MPGDIISLFRARLSHEKGTAIKDWGGKVSVALAYPNHYRLGMSNLGFQVVYHLLNQRTDVVAERVFLPEGHEMSLLLQAGGSLISLESQRRLSKFDLIAFSLSFENDYPNILKILELGKIPLLSEQRPPGCPFVVAGGITTFLNPEPLSSFMDFFLLGEAESNLNQMLDHFSEYKGLYSDRKKIIRNLSQNVTGLYAPSLYQPEYNDDGTIKSFSPRESMVPAKIKVCRSACDQVQVSKITTPETEFGDRILIELGRGCGRSCRFCAAGFVYRPPRIHPKTDLMNAVQSALKTNTQLGLLASNVSDIPGIEAITAKIVENGGSFSVSSLRADTLTQAFLSHLAAAGQKTLAIAPEAGSDRLRRAINKHLTKEQIIDSIKLIASTEDFAIRLYFLIGLPTETNDDIEALVDLVKVIKHHMVKQSAPRGRIGQIRLSINCFVPKPFTPFQWFCLEDMRILKERQKRLKKELGKEGGVKVNFDVAKWAYIQALLSTGDRRVGSILLKAHSLKGDWTKALKFSEINPDFFVYRPRGIDETLPWDFVDNGIEKSHLAKEYRLSLEAKESEICHVGKCYRCGVCKKERIHYII